MDRRVFMGSAALLSAAAVPAVAAAQTQKKHDHHNHKHSHGAASSANPYASVVEAAADCVSASQICLAHCVRLLSKGDTDMADCAQSVMDTIALCNALRDMAAHGSSLTPALAKVCIEGCKKCAENCKQHAEHHEECRECHESCLDCVKACEKIAA